MGGRKGRCWRHCRSKARKERKLNEAVGSGINVLDAENRLLQSSTLDNHKDGMPEGDDSDSDDDSESDADYDMVEDDEDEMSQDNDDELSEGDDDDDAGETNEDRRLAKKRKGKHNRKSCNCKNFKSGPRKAKKKIGKGKFGKKNRKARKGSCWNFCRSKKRKLNEI